MLLFQLRPRQKTSPIPNPILCSHIPPLLHPVYQQIIYKLTYRKEKWLVSNNKAS